MRQVQRIIGVVRSLWQQVDTRKLRRYGIMAGIVIAAVVVLALVDGWMDRRGESELTEAIMLRQAAEAAESQEDRVQKLEEARDLLERAWSRYPWADNRHLLAYYLGVCEYALGDHDAARGRLEKWVNKHPNDYFTPLAQSKLAAILENQGEIARALDTYQDLAEEHPESGLAPDALLGVARCQELMKSWQSAYLTYQELMSRYPMSSAAAFARQQVERLRVEQKVET